MPGRQVQFMENKKEEQMIYVKDLIFAALRRYKAVLAVALILALVLGGMQAFSGLTAKQTPVDPAVLEELQTQYEKDKADAERLVEAAQNSLDSYQDYLANALFMQLNPYGHYETRLSLYVQTDYQIQPGMSYQDPDRTADILTAYEAVLRGDAAMDAMATALDTDAKYVSEVLTVKKTDQNGTLQMVVKLPAEDAAKTLLPVLAEQVDLAQVLVEKTVAEHTTSVVESSVVTTIDASVADQQQKSKDRVTALENALADAESALAAVSAPNAGTSVSVKSVIKKAVIFAVLGAVLGVFVTVCVIWVMHIASDKVYGVRNLTNRTGVKVIGAVEEKTVKGLDSWLKKLEGRDITPADTRLTTLAVDIRCRLGDGKYLLVTGSGDTQALVEALSHHLPGVQVECGNILESAAALESLKACDAVVLAEACGSSCYSVVERQVRVIADYNKQLLGCVLIGG